MDKQRIKILHVTFNMGIGGTEQVIRQIIKNSDHDRFSHEILCIDGEAGPIGEELKADGIIIHSLKRKPGVDFNLLRSVRRIVQVNAADIIHCHQYTPYFYGVLGSFLTGAKVIFTEHGRFYPDRHNFKRRFINPILSLFTAQVTTISESTKNALSEYEYINRKKIKVIYNGIKPIDCSDEDRKDLLTELGLSDKDARYIGTISRLEPIKNQTMMIKAFKIVKEEIPHLKLILIGDGAMTDKLKQLACDLGLEDEVVFTGFIDNPQKYINLFDLFLLSSFSEGTSMTLLEAMSLSKPCVVTDVGGNPEIVVHEKTGIVVPSDDETKFAEAILLLMNDEGKKQAFGKSGYLRFDQKFTARHMVDDYHLLYTEI